jgi:acetylornithine deacetylase
LAFSPPPLVYLQSVVEEESTGNGALMTHLRGYRADAVLIPEPEDEKLVRANVGVLWFEIEVRGKPAHVREMDAGANAIDAAYRVITDLRRLEEELNRRKAGRAHFETHDHPINLNIGTIEGGDWGSSVPCWCKVQCRLAIYPGVAAREAAREVEDWISAFARQDRYLANNPPRVTFNGFFAEGYELEPGSEAEAALGRAHQEATGEALQSFMTGGYLDTRVYALYDQVPALCYGPVSKNIHAFDEAVSVASLRRITTAMTLFVAEWCGVEPVSATERAATIRTNHVKHRPRRTRPRLGDLADRAAVGDREHRRARIAFAPSGPHTADLGLRQLRNLADPCPARSAQPRLLCFAGSWTGRRNRAAHRTLRHRHDRRLR